MSPLFVQVLKIRTPPNFRGEETMQNKDDCFIVTLEPKLKMLLLYQSKFWY